ncbi:DUF4345 family protein [Roseibium sp.]|uniref:DUF4345 family protein n=1 Tax=Roseibium sp. TaxID=1936156 RepID=UPI003B516056
MEFALQIMTVLAAIMLFGLGMTSMFVPGKMLKNFSVEPIGTAGLSTIRSVAGGLFLASFGLIAFGLATGRTEAFLPVALLMAAVVIGRVVGLIADGFDKSVVPPIIVELVIIAVLVNAHAPTAMT